MQAIFELAMVELLDAHPSLTKKEFQHACKKIADTKWRGKIVSTSYQEFVKNNMARLSSELPDMNPRERMKLIGTMWKQI